MTQRIWVLTRFLIQRTLFSLTGVLYVILALVYWRFLFPAEQGTPDIENYFLIIGAFGAVMAFVVTLTAASRANEAANYPLLVRLPSRVEFLTAVLLTSFLVTLMLQLLVAALALIGGPNLLSGRALEIPPIWLATNILAAVLAMHASDFVARGWSRVYIYGTLALFLVGQSSSSSFVPWLARRLNTFSVTLINRGWLDMAASINRLVSWLYGDGVTVVGSVLGFVFWPFRAITEAIINGYFDTNQALAPAVMLLYATILFMLAADLFANKDLDFIE